jgi:tetratricopeptide (TPR) repeat protein
MSSKSRPTSARFPISFVMIVRDEAARIGRCLASVQGLVEEIVVIDTGSADDTVAIAESFGARVHHFTWVDDFAAARNFALAQARHPWRLMLDADEWIADRDHAASVLDRVRQLAPTFIGGIDILDVVEETGELNVDILGVPMPRLLPRQVEYAGRIHEQPASDLRIVRLELLVGHDGYTTEAKDRKGTRNADLLNAALAEDPENAYLWYQLGQEHYARGRRDEALPALIKSYNLLHPVAPGATPAEPRPWWHRVTLRLMLTLIALGRHEEAVSLGEQEAETWMDSADFFCVFGSAVHGLALRVAATDRAQADELFLSAIGCWLHAVEQGDKHEYTGSLTARGTMLSAQALVETYERLGRFADADRFRALASGETRAPVLV